jgi:hypothetical protein
VEINQRWYLKSDCNAQCVSFWMKDDRKQIFRGVKTARHRKVLLCGFDLKGLQEGKERKKKERKKEK